MSIIVANIIKFSCTPCSHFRPLGVNKIYCNTWVTNYSHLVATLITWQQYDQEGRYLNKNCSLKKKTKAINIIEYLLLQPTYLSNGDRLHRWLALHMHLFTSYFLQGTLLYSIFDETIQSSYSSGLSWRLESAFNILYYIQITVKISDDTLSFL